MENKPKTLANKLKTLPIGPGVYFHKDKSGEIIYVGKASVLKNRVRQYFQTKRDIDLKTQALVEDIYDTDWVETDSEIDALFLEAEMVKRYMPKYNILLRDDKSLTYIRIDIKNPKPYVSFTRNPADDGAEYFGPYYNSFAIKKALRFLRRVFPYYIRPVNEKSKNDLDDHLGLSPINQTDKEYKNNLRQLIGYITGDRKKIVADLKKKMNELSTNQKFEEAANIRNQLYNLNELKHRIIFGDKEFLDISKDEALNEITKIFNFNEVPKRIEGFDVSHMSGTNVVSSMVVFKNGVSSRSEYRKFKIKFDQNNDFYNMSETITRRFSEKNIKEWGKPDLVVIDGGKGQIEAAIKARNAQGSAVPFIGLAKRDEQIIIEDINCNVSEIEKMLGYVEKTDRFTIINLPKSSSLIKLLQRIRDESHRFAVSYHSAIKISKQKTSVLDEISGIGPKTKAKLIKHFGSINKIASANYDDIVKLIGSKKAKLVSERLKAL